jgi:hypothetical protein
MNTINKQKGSVLRWIVGLATVLVCFGVVGVVVASCWSYHDSYASLSGCTNGTFYDNPGNNYRHSGYTWGSVYPGVPLSYVRVSVTSFDQSCCPGGGVSTCNTRNTDSGNKYGFYSTGDYYTSWASVYTCTGTEWHSYWGASTHWFGANQQNSSAGG